VYKPAPLALEANLQAQSLPEPKDASSRSPWDCENLQLEKMSCHVPPDACYVVCDMDAAHTRGHGKIHILTEDRCFASDRQQYRAQAGEFFLVTFSCLKRTVHLSEKIGRNFHPVKKLFFNWGRNNSRKHCWKTNMTLKIGNASSCIVDFPASPVSFRFLY